MFMRSLSCSDLEVLQFAFIVVMIINRTLLVLEEKDKIQNFSVGEFLLFFSFVVLLNFCLLM